MTDNISGQQVERSLYFSLFVSPCEGFTTRSTRSTQRWLRATFVHQLLSHRAHGSTGKLGLPAFSTFCRLDSVGNAVIAGGTQEDGKSMSFGLEVSDIAVRLPLRKAFLDSGKGDALIEPFKIKVRCLQGRLIGLSSECGIYPEGFQCSWC